MKWLVAVPLKASEYPQKYLSTISKNVVEAGIDWKLAIES